MANLYPNEDIQKLLYEYNLLSDEDTKFDCWFLDQDQRTYRFANVPLSTNVLVQYEPE